MDQSTHIDVTPYADRRRELVATVESAYPEFKKGDSCILILANVAHNLFPFNQESSFFYLTGIEEAGAAITIDAASKTTLFVPQYKVERHPWFFAPLIAGDTKRAQDLSVNAIAYLGNACEGLALNSFFTKEEYANMLAYLEGIVARGGTIFTLLPSDVSANVEQRVLLNHMMSLSPALAGKFVDISSYVYAMRRKKDPVELGTLFQAAEITMAAHEAVAQSLEAGKTECELAATAEGVFASVGACPAYVSLIASGPHGPVIHYTPHLDNRAMLKEDLVIVDAGAQWGHYCADVTRTYPVSGTFTPRQRELYNLVLDTQRYIETLAVPGYWLKNEDNKEKSLTHLARTYLDDHGGYGKYMIHGIGHFLGLDVHDVGDYSLPLSEGDVITIEPGLYIPEEGIGIRIEDDYWIGEHAAMCLTEELPKSAEDIEAFVQGTYEFPQEDGHCCDGCDHEHETHEA